MPTCYCSPGRTSRLKWQPGADLCQLNEADSQKLLAWIEKVDANAEVVRGQSFRMPHRAIWCVGAAYIRCGKEDKAVEWLQSACKFDADG